MTVSQLTDKMRNETRHKSCFVNDSNCSSQIINAHSIQNNRILKYISVDGSVVNITITNGKFNYSLIGRKKASTFSGFCSFHDDSIFKYIETNDFISNDEIHFILHAYRALAIEYNKKMSTVKMFKKFCELMETRDGRALIKNCVDFTKSAFSFSDTYRNYTALITGNQLELDNMDHFRDLFHNYFINHNNSFLKYFSVSFMKEYPIAATSSITIEYDFTGNRINDFSVNSNTKPLYFTIFPQNGQTFILFSYYIDDKGYFKKFENSIKTMNSNKLKITITNLIANHIENFYVSPKYWENIDSDTKAYFIRKFENTLFSAGKDLSMLDKIDIFK